MNTILAILFAMWAVATVWLWRLGRKTLRRHRELELERRSFSADRNLLRALLAQSTDHIYFKDARGHFLLVSSSLARALGVDNPDDLIGKTDADFFGRTEIFDGEEAEQEVLRTGRPLKPYVRAKHWPDGQLRWKSTCKWPLVDERGRVWGTFGISRDVPPPEKEDEKPVRRTSAPHPKNL